MAMPKRKQFYDPHAVACAAEEKHELKYLIRRMDDFHQQLTRTVDHERRLQERIDRRIAAIAKARARGEELRRQEAEKKHNARENEKRKRKLERGRASHVRFVTDPAAFVAPLAAEQRRIARCQDRARRLAGIGITPPADPMEDHANFTWTVYQTAVSGKRVPVFKILRVPHDGEERGVERIARQKIAKKDKAGRAGGRAHGTSAASCAFGRIDPLSSPSEDETTVPAEGPAVVGGVVVISDSDDD